MKNLVAVIVLLGLLGVGGYYVMNSQKAKPPMTEKKTPVSTQQSGNVFTSIKDALTKSLSLKCEYPDPRTKATVTTYIKNGAVRVMGMSIQNNKSSNAIIKDNKMWIWTEGDKQGMMLTLSIPAVGKPSGTPQIKEDQRERVLAEMERFKNNCKTETVDDSLFVPPSNVTFTDLQNMMKGVGNEMMKKFPPGMTKPTVGEEPNQ
ncbi:hypothetical protein HY041_02090 [Candidatus Roizmanbacteria bacterium]|nr:hypothetical protein [Candidatus Roizmanbacteria bacterium]